MLPNHVEFIKANETEFCVMLCKELPENKEDGITFKEFKDEEETEQKKLQEIIDNRELFRREKEFIKNSSYFPTNNTSYILS